MKGTGGEILNYPYAPLRSEPSLVKGVDAFYAVAVKTQVKISKLRRKKKRGITSLFLVQ